MPAVSNQLMSLIKTLLTTDQSISNDSEHIQLYRVEY